MPSVPECNKVFLEAPLSISLLWQNFCAGGHQCLVNNGPKYQQWFHIWNLWSGTAVIAFI